jgi:hypothetical protein
MHNALKCTIFPFNIKDFYQRKVFINHCAMAFHHVVDKLTYAGVTNHFYSDGLSSLHATAQSRSSYFKIEVQD